MKTQDTKTWKWWPKQLRPKNEGPLIFFIIVVRPKKNLSKASSADVNFHMEFIAFKLQNISAVTTTCFLPKGFRSFGNWNGQTLCKKFRQNQINTGKM